MKKGVGKSTFSTTLAFGLSKDVKVSLIDIDICGPSIPKMTATEGESIHTSNYGLEPISVTDNLTTMSVAYMYDSFDFI